ncbi:restriction endonuclease subunit S [Bacillus sp. FSL R9-6406]|uniref:restriction endonuclease subunit S n=1 Tax=Bacillus sp. FSL R9-6406 TaxID=2978207 RepID=UPI0030F5D36E|nr:restriction endonuclease subunit S [Bacillus cereus]HDR7972962.1 restriction endonuclease subunit S [Bacillus cereus]
MKLIKKLSRLIKNWQSTLKSWRYKMLPSRRFKEFKDNHLKSKLFKISDILIKVKNPVSVKTDEQYREIGIRSHGKGIFYKEPVLGKELGNKSVFWLEPNCLILNIVFAWEGAVACTTEMEKGYIASHRFPMYKPIPELVNINYITLFFKTNKGKYLLGLASPGGAGRNKTLGQKEFERLEINIPPLEEQQKVATFFSLFESRIEKQQDKVEALQLYKKEMVRKIFSLELRFKDDEGNNFPDWKEYKLSEVLNERKEKCKDRSLEVHSVAVRAGVVNQIEHLGRVFAAKDISKYKVVKLGDIIYTKSPTGEFPYGIVKQSQLNKDVIVSPLYGVYEPLNYHLGYLLHSYFSFPINLNNYLHSIVNKGAKNTININNKTFVSKSLFLPSATEEQQKISNFFLRIDEKIKREEEKLVLLKKQKQGLLQEMFI